MAGGFGFPGMSAGLPVGAGITGTPAMTMQQPILGGSGGLSKLIKGLEKDETGKTGSPKDSQMVTIRRVVDPVSSEPTVTISVKGEEACPEKVLYKLVNGQGNLIFMLNMNTLSHQI